MARTICSWRVVTTLGDGIYGPPSLKIRGLPLAQDPETDYGKVVQISLSTGKARRLTLGQRNMQGIALGREGRIWTSSMGCEVATSLTKCRRAATSGGPTRVTVRSIQDCRFHLFFLSAGIRIFSGPSMLGFLR